jgi:hypothetical protein
LVSTVVLQNYIFNFTMACIHVYNIIYGVPSYISSVKGASEDACTRGLQEKRDQRNVQVC